MSVKNYKKINRDYIDTFGVCNVYFDYKLIGVLNIKNNLILNINEEWQDYTCDDTGNNIRESKLIGIDIRGNIELIYNKETSYNFSNITKKNENNGITSINISEIGKSIKKGVLLISPLKNNYKNKKDIYFYNCIFKTNETIDLNTQNYSKVNIEFISIPDINGNMLKTNGDIYFSFSSTNFEEYGIEGFDNGFIK